MKVVVIGGTGHVGTYLIPRLVELNCEVICVSRGSRSPYQPSPAWKKVAMQQLDRSAEEKTGAFGERIAALKPDLVVDMICYNPDSGRQLVEALRGKIQHLIVVGTIWTHGPSVQVPTREEENRKPFGDYGVNKLKLEEYLLDEARRRGLPATLIHPGHIVGPGWNPLNPQGNFNPEVFNKLARGDRLRLPNLGLETVHHVHADDVARLILAAMSNRSAALGESFHAVSPAAVSLRGYAETAAAWFGRLPELAYSKGDEWKEGLSSDDVRATLDHIGHSPNCSMEKAHRLLGFEPRYSSFEAAHEAVQWLVANKVVKTG